MSGCCFDLRGYRSQCMAWWWQWKSFILGARGKVILGCFGKADENHRHELSLTSRLYMFFFLKIRWWTNSKLIFWRTFPQLNTLVSQDPALHLKMGGSWNPKSSILIGFSIINHPISGTPIFGNIQLAIFLHSNFLSSRIRPWVFHISLMLRGHFRRWVDSSCGKSKVPFFTNMFLVRGIRAAPRKWWMDHGYPGMWMKGAWHLKDLNHEESFFGSTTH